ncbi:endonuclease/exonuclease/phosphatase family protein [Microlunatus panaciterrae]|uniref:Endonuclease/exonuclease/phosphatase family metal-dependent hydrolase n=1 Tax=Microlunatus panaciterrae TaxID=400768 RepID=A0ABS2REF6_9ACTN|nr:endonuclease/exonuclease/phosphatase family metal-dependent hydrolase [Microlunatus panaciterrae]
MAEFLRSARPAVLGTQEGLVGQLRDMAADLPDGYDWVGQGRRGGTDDEFCAVFFDTGLVEPLKVSHGWLSDTPEVAGSTGWGNSLPRMFTAVTFRDRDSGSEFDLVNTHLDHQSAKARLASARMLQDRARQSIRAGRPVVVLGDFNADAERSPEYQLLIDTPLQDSHLVAGTGQQIGTVNGYGPPGPGPRIDWILTGPGVEVRSAGIVDNGTPGGYASDHLPVQAEIWLPPSRSSLPR